MNPFDTTGVHRDGLGVKHYTDLPVSVIAMLRGSVEPDPDGEAVVVLDGPRVSYQQVWDRSARVSGGLREAGIRRGDRVAIRSGNGLDWVLGFFGTLMAGGVGSREHPVHRQRGGVRDRGLRGRVCGRAGCAAA